MSLPLSVPSGLIDKKLHGVFRAIIQLAANATGLPFFVDEQNQRVLIGTRTASTSNAGKLEVNGDIGVQGNGNGLILRDANGVAYRLMADTDGAVRLNPL